METSKNKKRGEDIRIIFHTTNNIENKTPKIRKINNDDSVEDISDDNIKFDKLLDKTYYIDYTLPNDDCYLHISVDYESDFIKVGNPKTRFLMYLLSTGKDIQYTQYLLDGSKIDDGDFTEYDNGIYGFILENNDDSFIVFSNNDRSFNVNINNTGNGYVSGKIRLNTDNDKTKWQHIAIPVKDVKVKEYFLDWIDDKIKEYDDSKGVEDVVERVTTFTNGVEKAVTFIPNSTPVDSNNNFLLVRDDNDIFEITSFLVLIKDYKDITDGEDLIFEWNN